MWFAGRWRVRWAALLLVVPLAAAPESPSRPGSATAAIYVVAARDANLLAPCRGTGTGSLLRNPLAFPGPELLPESVSDWIGGVPFPELRATIEHELTRSHRYTVASSADAADLVFFAESRSSAVLVSGRMTSVGVDVPRNLVYQIDAIVMPSAAWRRSTTEVTALVSAPVWQAHVVGVNTVPASPTDMVRRFLKDYHGVAVPGIARVSPASSYSTPNFWRDFEDVRDAWERGPLPEPRQPDVRKVPASERDSFCAVRQPPRAPSIEPVATASLPLTPNVAPPPASASPPTYRAGVTAVLVPVVALDARGAYVGGLNVSDFRLFEDDVEQPIGGLLDQSLPITVALVLDTSWSMRRSAEAVRASASWLIDGLRPDDAVMVIAFDSRTYLVCDATTNRDVLTRGLLRIQSANGRTSRLYDTLLATRDRLEAVAGRKAIVLMTDGIDVGSGLVDGPGALSALQASNAPIFIVQYAAPTTAPSAGGGAGSRTLATAAANIRVPPRVWASATTYLEALGAATGGRFEHATTSEGIRTGFARIAEESGA